ncbi:hypothetical protein DYI23_05700 [Roseibium polysiphoniae]|uniref:Uncharacterized protein n=1 Tax=Roseibium polysiphoniae TaxID=2571221 RepID=A0A944CC48_9HYPH|nr:hypothetical protein [Roseibium polysiphoniae]MBS8259707.1 hypothetical protein [Roseibium polysiphoniae]
MGKAHVNHRVVIRDEDDNIVLDESCVSFAVAKPLYYQRRGELLAGETITLQHGARVIFKD